MNKLLENNIIKSTPKKWTEEEIQRLKELKAAGNNIKQIAKILKRTEISVGIKYKRLSKTNNTYNVAHRKDKYFYNEKFLFEIQPKTILDLYSADSFYKKYDDIVLIDNDKDINYETVFNLDAFQLLCLLNMENKKFDLVDLDPYGSAIDCFDLAIRIAKKGIVITLGEMGHKRWKRLDYVRTWYGIQTLEDFTTDNIIKKLKERALCYKKEITPIYIRDYNRISRVWFSINDIKITEQWEGTNGEQEQTVPQQER
jgi:hypothetical protein